MRFNTLFFDLDDTLYPHDSGLWGAIAARIQLYLNERMGFPPEQAGLIQKKYFQEYGTTLRGLQAKHNVDMDEYLAFVHDVPVGSFIHPEPGLREAIAGLPARKFIFTNADANHANRVLEAVGLQGIFEGIIDVHTLAPFCKPMPGAFELPLKTAGSPDVHACVLLDDQRRITRAGRDLGWYTILVGEAQPGDDSDAALLHLSALPTLLNQ